MLVTILLDYVYVRPVILRNVGLMIVSSISVFFFCTTCMSHFLFPPHVWWTKKLCIQEEAITREETKKKTKKQKNLTMLFPEIVYI